MRYFIIILLFFNSVACTKISKTDETLPEPTEQAKHQEPKVQRQSEKPPKPEPPQQQAAAVDQPKIKYYDEDTLKKNKDKAKHFDPAMPEFTLKTGESVFVIDRIECKSENEAFILFYEGQLQELQDSQVEVNVKKRYAMWYDIRHEGVSKTDWWCIPKKRFCYSSVSFTDWDGKLKSGEVASFEKKLTMPSRFDIVSLVAQSSKRECSF